MLFQRGKWYRVRGIHWQSVSMQNPCCVWSRMGRRWTLRCPYTHSFQQADEGPCHPSWLMLTLWLFSRVSITLLLRETHCSNQGGNIADYRWPGGQKSVWMYQSWWKWGLSLGDKRYSICVPTPRHQAQQSPSCTWPLRKASAWGQECPVLRHWNCPAPCPAHLKVGDRGRGMSSSPCPDLLTHLPTTGIKTSEPLHIFLVPHAFFLASPHTRSLCPPLRLSLLQLFFDPLRF